MSFYLKTAAFRSLEFCLRPQFWSVGPKRYTSSWSLSLETGWYRQSPVSETLFLNKTKTVIELIYHRHKMLRHCWGNVFSRNIGELLSVQTSPHPTRQLCSYLLSLMFYILLLFYIAWRQIFWNCLHEHAAFEMVFQFPHQDLTFMMM
jgi:hypothetical protein